MLRFAFGAVISIVVGVVSNRFGPKVGGLFLAFPAIMPASLTLIEDKENRLAADRNAAGAVLGSLGLLVFAATAAMLFARLSAVLVLAVATGAWAVTAVVAYLLAHRLLHFSHDGVFPWREPRRS